MKKRNKRYNPRKWRVDRLINPLDTVRLQNSTAPLPEHDIAGIIAPIAEFIERLKNGSCTREHYWHAIENNYLYIRLIEELLQKPQLNADPAQELHIRIQLAEAKTQALDGVGCTVIQDIGTRAQARGGRFIASGDEIRQLEQALANYRQLLRAIDERHYFAAFLKAERMLEQLQHNAKHHHAA